MQLIFWQHLLILDIWYLNNQILLCHQGLIKISKLFGKNVNDAITNENTRSGIKSIKNFIKISNLIQFIQVCCIFFITTVFNKELCRSHCHWLNIDPTWNHKSSFCWFSTFGNGLISSVPTYIAISEKIFFFRNMHKYSNLY